MNRVATVVFAMALVSASMAQSFTIRRPADGSTVRETVKVLIPAGSISEGQYIGVIINGKFIEAAMPVLEGDNYVYTLDTKARRIPDGEMDLEIVLYNNFSDRVEVSNRSSVRVKLDNYTSIKMPEDGLKLRYKFVKGKELTYSTSRTQSAGMVSQAASQLGSRAGEVPVEEESVRMLYAFDNVYPNGEALIRIQALPDKGKNYTYLTLSGDTQAKKYFDFQMHPVYMRINQMGRELEGAVPAYFPLEGSSGSTARLDLYAPFPLPLLPEKALYPGDSWESAHLFSTLNLARIAETERVTTALRSRGTFLGVEWEKGIPCAKFNIAVDAGPRDMTNVVNLNNQEGEATKVSLDGMVWFSLDQGVIVKSELNLLQESLITIGTSQAGNAGGGIAGAGAPTGGFGSAAGGASTAGGSGGSAIGNWTFDPFIDKYGNLNFFRQRRGGPPGAGPGGLTGGSTTGGASTPGQNPGGAGFGQRQGGGSGGEQKMLLRVRLRVLTELEK